MAAMVFWLRAWVWLNVHDVIRYNVNLMSKNNWIVNSSIEIAEKRYIKSIKSNRSPMGPLHGHPYENSSYDNRTKVMKSVVYLIQLSMYIYIYAVVIHIISIDLYDIIIHQYRHYISIL